MELARPEELGFSPARLARIRPILQGYIDRAQIAGTISLIARRGRIVHYETAGLMGLDTNKPMRRDSIFRIYSMSKPITSVAVMMLLEEGLIRLADPVSRYLPMFREMRVYTPRGGADFDLLPAQREITIHDLLIHTAGMSYGFDPKSYVDELYRQKIWKLVESKPDLTLEEAISEAAKLPLAHQPGSAFRYSFATDVLGYLVQVISGKSLDIFLKERIFDPLSMNDTGFWVPPEKIGRFTSTHGPDENGDLRVIDAPATSAFARPTRNFSGGGGLVSTTEDYLRFCQMLLSQGRLGNTRLLGRKTVELMFANHLPVGVPFTDPGYGFGLGGYVLLNPALARRPGSVGSWGWGGAANTRFWIDPHEELIAMVMLQYMPDNTYPIENDYFNLVYQALVD